ncbi:MAG: N-acetylglucosamine-6-phosphate deacetylase [Planctomycetaceae bacterium]
MRPFDLQVNGYAGVDFCSSSLTHDELQTACEALKRDGVDNILATVITDTVDSLVSKLSNLVKLREDNSLAQQLITGVHIEGPFLNPAPGYIGAHPPAAVVPATPDDARRLLDAAGGLTRMFTLAPEQDSGHATTRFLVEQGVTVSAGHCNPSLSQLQGAIDAGLSMVTHFGNGCPVELPRHDNVLQRILACRSDLWICFIPDGAHVNFFALKNYLDLVGIDRSVMVTDCISAATLGPGKHEVSGMVVEVDADGVARRPGSVNLAGSTITMPGVQSNLAEHLGLDEPSIRQLIDENPRRAVGMESR